MIVFRVGSAMAFHPDKNIKPAIVIKIGPYGSLRRVHKL